MLLLVPDGGEGDADGEPGAGQAEAEAREHELGVGVGVAEEEHRDRAQREQAREDGAPSELVRQHPDRQARHRAGEHRDADEDAHLRARPLEDAVVDEVGDEDAVEHPGREAHGERERVHREDDVSAFSFGHD
ncbi:MAG: hypothetical protein M5U28_16985 [Sandaracinaceae bacterium]|nr:hypothetical protein [Sandaracinaceae bacterium]